MLQVGHVRIVDVHHVRVGGAHLVLIRRLLVPDLALEYFVHWYQIAATAVAATPLELFNILNQPLDISFLIHLIEFINNNYESK